MTQTLSSFTIIGGGFSGLSAAYDLARAGHKVTVLEADRYLGGSQGPSIRMERGWTVFITIGSQTIWMSWG